jgi:prevent-host-death family protein
MHPKAPWRLQDAKAQFSAVVDAALGGEAQLVTRRGKRAVVVLDAGEYERLRQGERALAPGFIDHLLAIPRPLRRARARAETRPAIALRDMVLD